jgi:hypothetical protein
VEGGILPTPSTVGLKHILIWIFAASSLMGVVGTKVARALSIRRHPVFREKRQSTRVNISNVVTFSNEEFKIKY